MRRRVYIETSIVSMDFLLTWNVAHIANASLRRRVEDVCRAQGQTAPILCTPDELMEETDD